MQRGSDSPNLRRSTHKHVAVGKRWRHGAPPQLRCPEVAWRSSRASSCMNIRRTRRATCIKMQHQRRCPLGPIRPAPHPVPPHLEQRCCLGVQEGTQHAIDPHVAVQGGAEVPLCQGGDGPRAAGCLVIGGGGRQHSAAQQPGNGRAAPKAAALARPASRCSTGAPSRCRLPKSA